MNIDYNNIGGIGRGGTSTPSSSSTTTTTTTSLLALKSTPPWASWVEFIRLNPVVEEHLTESLRCRVCGMLGWRPSVLECCRQVVVCAGCRNGNNSTININTGYDGAAAVTVTVTALAECPHCHRRRPTVAVAATAAGGGGDGDVVLARVLADCRVRCRICRTESTAACMESAHPWCNGDDDRCVALLAAHTEGHCSI